MKTLVFKETNKTFHKIVEVDGEKYLLDMTTISPKAYFWGRRVGTITAKMVKLEKHDKSFEGLAPTMSKSLGTAIGLLVGGAIYGIITNLFQAYQISHNVLLKLILFILSIMLSYITLRVLILLIRNSVVYKISASEQKFNLIFKLKSQNRQINLYKLLFMYVLVNLIILAFYFSTNNGTEGAFIVIIFLASLGFFSLISGMLPLRESYEKQEIIFEKIEEI